MVPAQAGPFDLGTVVVRAALFVDPHRRARHGQERPDPDDPPRGPVADPEINVLVDRAGFMMNPTSCTPSSGRGHHRLGGRCAVPVASRFQAAECASLGFEPKLALSLSGKGQTTDGKHPPVTAR